MRATLRRLLDRGDGRPALHLATLLGPYWAGVSFYREGQAWLEDALAAAHDAAAADRAWAYSWASWLATLRGAYEHGRILGEEGPRHFRQAGSRDIPMGFVLSAIQLGEFHAMQAFIERDLAECQELDDRHGVAACLHWLGEVALDQGLIDSPLSPSDAAILERLLASVHQGDDALFHVVYKEGQLMESEAAIAYALESTPWRLLGS